MRAAELSVLQRRTPNLLEAFAVFLHVVASQRFSIVCVFGFFELVAQRQCAYVPAPGWENRKSTRPAIIVLAAPNRKLLNETRFAIRQNPCSKASARQLPLPARPPTNPKSLNSRSQQTIARRLFVEIRRIAFACLRILLFGLTKRCCRVFANVYRCLVSDVLALE